MSQPDDDQGVPAGGIAALGLIAAVLWSEWRKVKRAANQPGEVALHQTALAAVEQARAHIHIARRCADQLRQHAVGFDVKAKLASAFTEELPPEAKRSTDQTGRQSMVFMVDDRERLPALKEAVERYLAPTSADRADGDEPASARSILRQAIESEGGLWSASKALAALRAAGWQSDSDRPVNVVGNLLAVMARDGEIRRDGRGMYAPLQQPALAETEREVAPGVFATEASPGLWIITGLDVGSSVTHSERSSSS